MDVASRIDRLESRAAIRDLSSRYAELIDARDVDGLTRLFVPDVRVSRTERGHDALRAVLDHICRRFTTSVHLVGGGQTCTFLDDDHGEGVVSCRAEHEYGDEWIVMAIQYWDRYERRDGEWLFTGRQPRSWYAVDHLDRPVGPDKVRWPETPPATIPHVYDTWAAFWSAPPT